MSRDLAAAGIAMGSGVAASRPLTDLAEAFSGATLDLVELADGTRLVYKHLAPLGDWLTRATNGGGRVRRMWETDLFERIGRFVDHTIVDVRFVEDHDVVVMRDATADLLPVRVPVSRDVSRRLLSGLAALHEGCRGVSLDDGCPLAARYSLFAPTRLAADDGPARHPSTDWIIRGWEVFAEHVDPDVVQAIFDVQQDPSGLGDRLAQLPSTLLHGDAKLENLGLSSKGVVAIDWGDITGIGPAEVDVAWYALKGCERIGCTPDEVFADYEGAAGRHLDPDALDVVCVGSVAQMGFRLAMGAYGFADAPPFVGELLRWWIARVRDALGRIG